MRTNEPDVYQIWRTGYAFQKWWHDSPGGDVRGWVIDHHLATDYPTAADAERAIFGSHLKDAVVICKSVHYEPVQTVKTKPDSSSWKSCSVCGYRPAQYINGVRVPIRSRYNMGSGSD